MNRQNLLALAALLIPLMFGALACDDNKGVPCVAGAGGGVAGSTDTTQAVSTDTITCVQGAVQDAVSRSTGTPTGGADPAGANPGTPKKRGS